MEEEEEHSRKAGTAPMASPLDAADSEADEGEESLRMTVLRETAKRLVSAPTDLVRKRRRVIKKDITRKNANLWISPKPVEVVLHYPVILVILVLAAASIIFEGIWAGLHSHPELGFVERYRHFRFLPLELQGGDTGQQAIGIRDFSVMRDGCTLDKEVVSSELLEGRLVKSYASELYINGWSVLLPAANSSHAAAVSFRLEGSNDLQSWHAVGSSSWRHTQYLGWVALDGELLPEESVEQEHRLDMRPPVAWWLWCYVLRFLRGVPLLVAALLVVLRVKRCIVAMLVALGGHGFASIAVGFALLGRGEYAYGCTALAVAFSDTVFFWAMATETLIVPAALSGIVMTIMDVIKFLAIYQQPQYLLLEMNRGGLILFLFGLWGARMKRKLVREAVEAIKVDMARYRLAWKECLARPDEAEAVHEVDVLTKTIRACLHKNDRPRHMIPVKHSSLSTPLPSLPVPVPSKAAVLLRSVQGVLRGRGRRASIESQESGPSSVGPSSISSSPEAAEEAWVQVKDLDQVFLQARAMDPIFRQKVWEWARQAGGMLPVRRSQEEETEGVGEKWSMRRRSQETQSSAQGREQIVFEAAETLQGMEDVAWADIKGIDRAIEKSQRVYGGKASRLVDVCRQRVVFERAEGIIRMLRVLLCDGIAVVRGIKNGMTSKKRGKKAERRHLAGFRAVTISISLATPDAVPICLHACELQLLLLPVAQVQATCNHEAYIFFRNAEAVRENSLSTWVRRNLFCQDSSRTASAFLLTVGVEEDEAGTEPPSRRASRVGSFMHGSFLGIGSMTDFATMFNRSFNGSMRNFGHGGSVLNRRARNKVHPADVQHLAQSPHASLKWKHRRISPVTAPALPSSAPGSPEQAAAATPAVHEAAVRLPSGGSDSSNCSGRSHRSHQAKLIELYDASRPSRDGAGVGVDLGKPVAVGVVRQLLPLSAQALDSPLQLPPDAPAPTAPEEEQPLRAGSPSEGVVPPGRCPSPDPALDEDLDGPALRAHPASGDTAPPTVRRAALLALPAPLHAPAPPAPLPLPTAAAPSAAPRPHPVLPPISVPAPRPVASPSAGLTVQAPLELPKELMDPSSPVAKASRAVDDMRLKSQAQLRLRRMAGAKVQTMVRQRLEREKTKLDGQPSRRAGLEEALSKLFAEAMTHPAGRLDKTVKKEHHRAMRGASIVSAFFTSQPLATALGFRRVRLLLGAVAALLAMGGIQPLHQLAHGGERSLAEVRFQLTGRQGPEQLTDGRLLLFGCEQEEPSQRTDVGALGVVYRWEGGVVANGWTVRVPRRLDPALPPMRLAVWGKTATGVQEEEDDEDEDADAEWDDEACLVPYWQRVNGDECAMELSFEDAAEGSDSAAAEKGVWITAELQVPVEHAAWAVTPLVHALGAAIAVAQAHRRKEGLAKYTLLVVHWVVAAYLLGCALRLGLWGDGDDRPQLVVGWLVQAAACVAIGVGIRLLEPRLIVMQGCFSALQLLLTALVYWKDAPSAFLALALAGDASIIALCVALLVMREVVLRRSSRLIHEDQRKYDAMWREIVQVDRGVGELARLTELVEAVSAQLPTTQVRQRCSTHARALSSDLRSHSLGGGALQQYSQAASSAPAALRRHDSTPTPISTARNSQDPAVPDGAGPHAGAIMIGRSTSSGTVRSSESGEDGPGYTASGGVDVTTALHAGWPVRSLDQVFWQAKAMHFVLKEKCKEWALASKGMVRSVGGKLVLWEDAVGSPALEASCKWSEVKSYERAIEKQLRSYGRDPSRLLDVCRQALIFETVADLSRCLQVLHDDASVRIVRLKNRLDPGYNSERSAGYRDLALNIQIITPVTLSYDLHLHVCELQLILQQVAELKSNEGHRRYVQFRNARGE